MSVWIIGMNDYVTLIGLLFLSSGKGRKRNRRADWKGENHPDHYFSLQEAWRYQGSDN